MTNIPVQTHLAPDHSCSTGIPFSGDADDPRNGYCILKDPVTGKLETKDHFRWRAAKTIPIEKDHWTWNSFGFFALFSIIVVVFLIICWELTFGDWSDFRLLIKGVIFTIFGGLAGYGCYEMWELAYDYRENVYDVSLQNSSEPIIYE